MSEPLKFINKSRAVAALRPLDPQKPFGQIEPWTLFDVEHYALSLGWKPPAGYKLARDPRILDPFGWWREFLGRYYVRGPAAGLGSLFVSHNFGGETGNIKIGDMLKRADFLFLQPPAVPWPSPKINHTPDFYRECAIGAVQMVEDYAPLALQAKWTNNTQKPAILDFMAVEFCKVLEPRNMQAMPPI